jgi:hypothetical protein
MTIAYDTLAPDYARGARTQSRPGEIAREMAALGFIGIDGCEEGTTFALSDAAAYRDKVFSCLQLIPEDTFKAGLRSMESDLRAGPLQCASELAFLWAQRP